MSLRLGAETVRDHLVASRAWLLVLGAVGTVCALGARARASDESGIDRVLLGLTLPLVAPLVCYALFELVHRRARTAALLEPLARHGADRRTLALGALLALLAACALVTSVLLIGTVLSAHTLSSGVAHDLDACAWGGALTGSAYAGLFALGSLRGRAGRLWLLVGDLIFGSGSGVFALPWPRGHARNLLGGAAVLDVSPVLAGVVLALLSACFVLASASRGPS